MNLYYLYDFRWKTLFFFQIKHNSKSYRYFGLKEDKWISQEQYRKYQFGDMLEYLKKSFVQDDEQIIGKLF